MEGGSTCTEISSAILLSPKLLQYCQQIYHIGSLTQAIPYKWVRGRKYPELQPSILAWRINSYLHTVFVFFVVVRAIHASFGEVDITSKLSMAFFAALILLGYSGDFPVIFNREEHLSLACRALEFAHEFQRLYTAEPAVPNKRIKVFEKMLQVVGIGLFGNLWSLSISAFLFPSLPTFFTSILWDVGFGNTLETTPNLLLLVRVTNGTIMAYALYITWSNAMANLVALTFLAPSVMIVMKEMGSSVCTNASFRKLTTKVNVYIQLSMLVNELSKVFGVLIASIQFMTMVMTIFCAYCALRLGGIVGFISGAAGLYSLIINVGWFTVMANIGENSKNVVQGWKQKGQVVEKEEIGLKKRIALLRPLWIRVGSFYLIDKMLVVTICKVVFESTVNALLIEP